MKLYDRAIVSRRLERQRKNTVGDRDGIIWSVDTGNYYCLVKIQGSTESIKAHYPRNWQVVPTWLKVGNAVRIRHREGVGGFIEVIGHGRAVPTPIAGDVLPPSAGKTDGIISGMLPVEYSGGGMTIRVTDGVYRIDDTLYSFSMPVTGYTVMDDPAPMTMGGGLELGWGETVVPVTIPAAPSSGKGRYDLLSIDSTGVITVTSGTAVSLYSEPAKPAVPANSVLIGYVFIYGGMTAIPDDAIGVEWEYPFANQIDPSSTMLQGNGTYEMAWNAGDDTPSSSITLGILNQYDLAHNISREATITQIAGTGDITGGDTKYCSTSVVFTYERNQLASPEIHPLFRVDFEDYPGLTYVFSIILLDIGGDPI